MACGKEQPCHTGAQCGAPPTRAGHGRAAQSCTGATSRGRGQPPQHQLPPERQRQPAEERGGSAATATGNRLQLASPGSSLEQPRPAAPLPGDQEPKAPCSRRRWGGGGDHASSPWWRGGTYRLFQALREATSTAQLSGLLRAHPASPCNQLAQRHLRQLKQQPQVSGMEGEGGVGM